MRASGGLAVLLVVLLFAFGAPARAWQGTAPGADLVRVGLLLGQESLAVACAGPFDLLDVESGRRETMEAGRLTARAAAGGLELNGVAYGALVRLMPRAAQFQVGGRPYRGLIELRRTPVGRVTAINELDLEEYLYGVVRSEMDPRWPPEALRAQAIAARSLAVHSAGRFAAEGYDVRATTDSQVYGGVAAEDARTTTAVDATRGLVLLHNGRPALAVFHADSGGATESSEYVWGSVTPHLRGVPDPFSRDAPGHEWTLRLELAVIEARLQRAGRSLTGINRLEVASTSPSGRVMVLRLASASGAGEIRGTEFRAAVGTSVLRSTLFAVRSSPGEGSVEFAGRGFGHGVGMSQWGARGMALAGHDYTAILKYFYTGVAIAARP
ncbi:MAG: SpoIID/LytB domain-containing protein [bacterium]|nr:SpoIID/LytB domain-containing protein [bacterium]